MKPKKVCAYCQDDGTCDLDVQHSEHTPTPWEVVATDTSVKIVASPTLDGQTTEPICDLEADQWTAKDPRTLADAAFIVCAVNCHEELIRTLKFLLGNHSSIRCGQSGWNFDKMEILAIQQAIAKAEGR